MKQNCKAKPYFYLVLLVWPLLAYPDLRNLVLPLYLLSFPLLLGLKLNFVPPPKPVRFMALTTLLGLMVFGFFNTGSEVFKLVIVQWIFTALPEEAAFRYCFYQCLDPDFKRPPSVMVLSNWALFLSLHLPVAGLKWTLVLAAPALILSLLGYRYRNLWYLSLIHLLFNLCDSLLTGNFVRDIT